jgi:TonB family protein
MRVGLCCFAIFVIGGLSLSAADPPKIIRIGSGVLRTHPIKAPSPEYPRESFRAGREGYVVATRTVEIDGSVSAVDIAEASDEPMGVAVARALKGWRFKPITIGANQPVRATSRFVFRFVIRDGKPEVVDGSGARHA